MLHPLLHHHMIAEERALNLPPGTLQSIVTDLVNLLLKYLPTIFGKQPGGLTSFHSDVAALETQRGLPPGTILGIITKLLPVLLQLLGGLSGTGTASSTP